MVVLKARNAELMFNEYSASVWEDKSDGADGIQQCMCT